MFSHQAFQSPPLLWYSWINMGYLSISFISSNPSNVIRVIFTGVAPKAASRKTETPNAMGGWYTPFHAPFEKGAKSNKNQTVLSATDQTDLATGGVIIRGYFLTPVTCIDRGRFLRFTLHFTLHFTLMGKKRHQ